MYRGVVFLGLLVVLVPLSLSQEDVPVNHEEAGVNVLVPDTVLFKSSVEMGKYWEPFTDVFGDGTLAVIAGAYPEGLTSGFNSKVAFFNPDGSMEEYWAFYTDDGEPYVGPFNEARDSGNPPRIATDRRPGGTLYVTGQESTPYMYDEFNTDGRWDGDFTYVSQQLAAVQFFNKTSDGPEPISNVIDPVYMATDISGTQSDQMRFGGDMRILSNGNILVVVEERNNVLVSFRAAVATIFDGETGEVVKEPFNAAGDDSSHSIWSNVAAFDGGFAVRTEGIMTLYDNDGNMLHVVNQEDWTMVGDTGRGDGTRIAASIDGENVYILGKDKEVGDMVVAAINGLTGEPVDEVVVNELEMWDYGNFDRGDLAVDEKGNVCLCYEVETEGVESQVVARILDSDLEPVTPTFFAFQNHDKAGGDTQGFLSKEVNVSMDNQRIIIAADGINLDPDTGGLTPEEHTFAIVLENPLKEDTPVKTWELY